MRGQVHIVGLVLLAGWAALAATPPSGVKATYLYGLAETTAGTLPLHRVRLSWDRQHGELYVVDISKGIVRIFNDRGMEIYAFGDSPGLRGITEVVALDGGDILALLHDGSLVRCDFRGLPKGAFALTGVPGEFSTALSIQSVAVLGGTVYLVDPEALKVVAVDSHGAFQEGYDMGAILELTEKDRADARLSGFSVSGQGDLLFTLPALFSAYVVSPDRKVRGFGQHGSAPGKFNVAVGVVADDQGYFYVADALRCVVMVFDREFRFQGEFGYRGPDPDNLIAPGSLAVGAGTLFVSQAARRGVSAFSVMAN